MDAIIDPQRLNHLDDQMKEMRDEKDQKREYQLDFEIFHENIKNIQEKENPNELAQIQKHHNSNERRKHLIFWTI